MPALIAHGWQDYNVKQEEGVELYKRLDGDPFKKLFVYQAGHGSPPDAAFLPVLDAFFGRVLKAEDTGIEAMPAVMTQGRDHDGPSASYTDRVAGSEEVPQRALAAEAHWLTYQTAPLAADTRIADAPVLTARITVDRDHGQLVPTLFDVDPTGAAVPISRGFLNLRYRSGLSSEEPVPVGEPFTDSPGLSVRVESRRSRLVLPVAP